MNIKARRYYLEDPVVDFQYLEVGDTFIVPQAYDEMNRKIGGSANTVDVMNDENRKNCFDQHMFMKIYPCRSGSHRKVFVKDERVDEVLTSGADLLNAVSLSSGDFASFSDNDIVVKVNTECIINITM